MHWVAVMNRGEYASYLAASKVPLVSIWLGSNGAPVLSKVWYEEIGKNFVKKPLV